MKFRRGTRRRIAAMINMTPLIDVVLLLLLFFMLSSTFIVHNAIPLQAPTAEGTPSLENKDISVTLAEGEGGPDNQGPIYVNDTPVASMAELSDQLSRAWTEDPNVTLLIRADARVVMARLVEVFGVARSAGIQRYQIAAQPPAELD